MSDIQFYEKIISAKGNKKLVALKILIAASVILVCTAWILLIPTLTPSPYFAVLIPIAVSFAAIFAWKFTSVEYEYSFVGGVFTFSKIFGNKKRKTIFSADIKKMIFCKEYSDAVRAQVSNADGRLIDAIPVDIAENPCICAFEGADGQKIYVLIECDRTCARIFAFYNSSATDRSIFN